jgi:hypothetical protein
VVGGSLTELGAFKPKEQHIVFAPFMGNNHPVSRFKRNAIHSGQAARTEFKRSIGSRFIVDDGAGDVKERSVSVFVLRLMLELL